MNYFHRGFRTALPAPNSRDVAAIKRNAFHDQNILVVNLDDPRIPWPERQILTALAEKLYGKPKTAGG